MVPREMIDADVGLVMCFGREYDSEYESLVDA